MKWLITGSRNINNKKLIFDNLSKILYDFGKPDLIIHGGCYGVDTISGWWANSNKIKVQIEKADWDKYGKAAGPIRNKTMADMLNLEDLCIAFWDGKSKGTKNMISLVKYKGNKIIVIGV